MKKVKLYGTIFSGGGEGKKFIELPWAKKQIEEKLGFALYSGTLNVKLSEESVKRRNFLDQAHFIEVCPAEGYCTGLLIKALIDTLECAIVIPDVVGYPKDALEIIAAVNLREALQLKDGSGVTVTVNL